jgi:hypothetical protein
LYIKKRIRIPLPVPIPVPNPSTKDIIPREGITA